MEPSDNNSLRQQVAARMREIREANRYSQADAARALGITQTSYSEMEQGQTRVRRRDMVTLAVFYGMTLEDAFPGVDVAA